jgi:hypothetical protein
VGARLAMPRVTDGERNGVKVPPWRRGQDADDERETGRGGQEDASGRARLADALAILVVLRHLAATVSARAMQRSVVRPLGDMPSGAAPVGYTGHCGTDGEDRRDEQPERAETREPHGRVTGPRQR